MREVFWDSGRKGKLFLTRKLPLVKIVGNVTYELVAWDMEGSNVGAMLAQA